MKKFHELTKEQQTKAKEHAKGVLVDGLLNGSVVAEAWPNMASAKVWAGALVLREKGMVPAAKAYLMQSQMFMRSVSKIIEAAAEAALYPEETDFLVNEIA